MSGVKEGPLELAEDMYHLAHKAITPFVDALIAALAQKIEAAVLNGEFEIVFPAPDNRTLVDVAKKELEVFGYRVIYKRSREEGVKDDLIVSWSQV